MNKYSLKIFWSDEDDAYLAICPEFPGLSAFGSTWEDALAEAQTALKLMIASYEESGLPLPDPIGAEDWHDRSVQTLSPA